MVVLCRLERVAEDSQQRTFELPRDDGTATTQPTVVNSIEIRFSKIEMGREKKILPELRRNPHRSGVLRTDHVAQVEKLVLPVVTEQLILGSCW